MKKTIRILFAVILAVVLCLGAFGCSFVNEDAANGGVADGGVVDEGGGVTDGSGTPVTGGIDYSSINFSARELESVGTNGSENKPITAPSYNSVTINRSAEENQLSLQDAASKTRRSVVALKVGDGAGAGVVFDMRIAGDKDTDVYILTCHHVISSKGDVTVFFADDKNAYDNDEYIFTGKIGGSFESNADKAVTLVGGDKDADLALLKVNLAKPSQKGSILTPDKIKKAQLAPDTHLPKYAEQVFAIGNPTGSLAGWFADGTIAIEEAETSVEDIGNMPLLGINVPTNPGNSGGGLFNLYGELIGITNAGSTKYTNINFAIPIYTSNKDSQTVIDNGIVNVVTNLASTYTSSNYGYVYNRRVKFGFTVSRYASGTNYFNQITAVSENSLAALAGIKVNDVITGFRVAGESPVYNCSFEQLNETLATMKSGYVVYLQLSRTQQTAGLWSNKQTTTVVVAKLTAEQFHFCNTAV